MISETGFGYDVNEGPKSKWSRTRLRKPMYCDHRTPLRPYSSSSELAEFLRSASGVRFWPARACIWPM